MEPCVTFILNFNPKYGQPSLIVNWNVEPMSMLAFSHVNFLHLQLLGVGC